MKTPENEDRENVEDFSGLKCDDHGSDGLYQSIRFDSAEELGVIEEILEKGNPGKMPPYEEGEPSLKEVVQRLDRLEKQGLRLEKSIAELQNTCEKIFSLLD